MKSKLKKYIESGGEMASIVMTAVPIVGEGELIRLLDQAEKQGKRLELTYPIPPEEGPSEPNGVAIR